MVERTYPYSVARNIADHLIEQLAPACHQVLMAGSLRRSVACVHDIDLVVHAKYDDMPAMTLFGGKDIVLNPPIELLRAVRLAAPAFRYPQAVDPKIIKFAYQDVPVELYLAERDGSNLAALLQMRTGSAQYNTWLASRAKSKGLYYKAGYGIFKSDAPDAARVDDGTEAGIWKALGLLYAEPEMRV